MQCIIYKIIVKPYVRLRGKRGFPMICRYAHHTLHTNVINVLYIIARLETCLALNILR